MSTEKDRILGHADECDGIEEYDNALPTWWLGLFIVCVIYAAVYVPYMHYVVGWTQAGEYDAEVAAAKELYKQPEAGSVAIVSTPEALAKGKEVYTSTCVACHGPELKGGIGPDLTDATWIHGGKPEEIAKTITEGVLDKGMPTWGPVLGPEKVAAVAAYIHSAGGGQ